MKRWWLLILGAGCVMPPPHVDRFTADPERGWARVVDRYVDDAGRIDFEGIRKSPADLEEYVSYLARVRLSDGAPRARKHRLAHVLNAYNALAMVNVVRSRARPRHKFRFFVLRRFVIGGKKMSLYRFENRVIRRLGDPRAHFALNCMSASCPRLPRVPFSAERIDEQLDGAAREFINDPRNVRLDAKGRRVMLSSIFKFYKGDFLAAAPSLIAYANRYRETPIPEDFEVVFLPYDWSLVSQQRGLAGASGPEVPRASRADRRRGSE